MMQAKRRLIGAIGVVVLLTVMAIPAAHAKSAGEQCDGEGGLELSGVSATLKRVDGVKTWTYDIETCEPFTPEDLSSPGDDGAYAMSLHIDTVDVKEGRFERTVEIYNCLLETDQVCAIMWAGHGQPRYYGGSRNVGEPEASQTSPTTVRVTFPNKWLGKKARDRSGFIWQARTAWDPQPGVIAYDYSPTKREHP